MHSVRSTAVQRVAMFKPLMLAAPVAVMIAGCTTSSQMGAGSALMTPPSAVVNVTNDPNFRWGEHQMVINPKNPNNIIIATVGVGFTTDCQQHSPECKMVNANFEGRPFPQPAGMFTQPDFNRNQIYTSFDRGNTWRRVFLPVHPPAMPDLQGMGDPSLAVAPDGTLYTSWDDNNWGTPEHGIPNTAIAVSKSTDGGLTWSDPVISGTPTDGPKITADQTTGTAYVGSTGALGPRSSGKADTPVGNITDRWLVSSSDGVKWSTPHPWGGSDGKKHYGAPGAFSAAFGVLGAIARVTDADACKLFGAGAAPCVVFQTTTDSGATWMRHRVPVTGATGSMVMIAADPTKKGHFSVAVSTEGNKGFQVFQTSDSGASWTGPTLITEDVAKTHFKPWLTYSRQGALAIMWRTFQPPAGQSAPAQVQGGPGGGPVFPYSIWAALSKDGGTTFSEPLKVSVKESDAADSSPFGGAGDDYSSLAIDGDYVFVGWANWLKDDRQNLFRAVKFSEFAYKH